MIAFRDFVPQAVVKAAPKILGIAIGSERVTYESFEAAVEAANAWIKQNAIQIVSIETVVLPNIHAPFEEGSEDAAIGTVGSYLPVIPTWHQFMRVWFQIENA